MTIEHAGAATMLTHLKIKLANMLLNKLFLTAPEMNLTPAQVAEFEAHYEVLQGNPLSQELPYRCSRPKHEFLRYIVQEKEVLLHGSNRLDLEVLTPRKQSDWNGRMMEAVFASGDGIWPLFFATVDHAKYRGSLRNGCFVVGDGIQEKRYYFFSLNAEYRGQETWRDGMIYLLPKETFKKTADGPIRFDEWASEGAVNPLGKLGVSPQDFPFLPQVAWHDEKEKMYTSWLRFKKRQVVRS